MVTNLARFCDNQMNGFLVKWCDNCGMSSAVTMCLRWDQLQMIIWSILRVPTSYEAALVPKISRKMNCCPCEQPQIVFIPEESRGGSGYSLSLCWDHKWTNLHSDIRKRQLWCRLITQHLLSHVFPFICSIKSILVVFMNGLQPFTSILLTHYGHFSWDGLGSLRLIRWII